MYKELWFSRNFDLSESWLQKHRSKQYLSLIKVYFNGMWTMILFIINQRYRSYCNSKVVKSIGLVKHKTISSSAIGHSGAHWRKLRTTFGYVAYFWIAIRSITTTLVLVYHGKLFWNGIDCCVSLFFAWKFFNRDIWSLPNLGFICPSPTHRWSRKTMLLKVGLEPLTFKSHSQSYSHYTDSSFP